MGFQTRHFTGIEIVDLASLGTGWATSLAQMSEFAKKVAVSPDTPLKPWAGKVYPGAVEETSIKRLSAFRGIVLSLQENKFFDFISAAPIIFTHPDNRKNALESKYLVHVLPRVCLVKSAPALDDGRHRAASLLALGVKRFPVVRCEFAPSKTGARCDLAPDYYQLFLDTLLKFSTSQEWLSYKTTACYKKMFTSAETHGLFSNHFVLKGGRVG